MNLKSDQNNSSAWLRIAIPNKGRLSETAERLLRNVGIEFEPHGRSLSAPLNNIPGKILLIRAKDIPRYVAAGKVDVAITGRDLVMESNESVRSLLGLGFGHTDLVVAVPKDSAYTSVKDLHGKSIATSFPNIARSYLKKHGVRCAIVHVGGAVEVAPSAGLADAIIDLVSSGNTLRVHNLRPLTTIMHSEAILISQKKLPGALKPIVDALVFRAQSVVNAAGKRYIMMNAPEKQLAAIKDVTPGLASPTVMKLAIKGMIAVHSVIEEVEVWDVVNRLRELGATGILITPIEKLIP